MLSENLKKKGCEMIYFFRFDANLLEGQVAQLQTAKIPFVRKENFDHEGPGLLVSERHALTALKIWRADVSRVDNAQHYYGRAKIVRLNPTHVGVTEPYEVTLLRTPGTYREVRLQNLIKAVVAPLLPHVQTDILIRFSDGDYVDIENYELERKFTIFFGGLRRHRQHTSHGSSPVVFGVKSAQSQCWDATDTANDFYDASENRQVAELWNRKLLIIHHSPSNDALVDCQVLQQLIGRVVHQLSAGAVSIEDTLRACMQSMQAEMLAFAQRMLAERTAQSLRETQDRIKNLRATCASLRKELVSKSRRLHELQEYEFALAQMHNDAPPDTLAKEFMAVTAHPQVINVQVTEKRLSIETDTLYCVNPHAGTRHELGKFTIEIAWHGDQAGNVVVINHTRRIDGIYTSMHAPVVDGEGRLFVKRYQEAIPKLIASNAWSTILRLTLQCLETTDSSDPASNYVKNWPLSEQQENQLTTVTASA